MTTGIGGHLDGFLDWVRANLVATPVVNFDETRLRVEGKLRWVHSASTGKYSLLFAHDRRGAKGMDAAGVLPEFTGIAVHDVGAPYDTYQALTHALCGAHLLRELQAVTDLAPEGQWCWATPAGDALGESPVRGSTVAGPQSPGRRRGLPRRAALLTERYWR